MDMLGCGSGSGCLVEIEVCAKCGEPLGDKIMTIYNGEEWRAVHASCAPTELTEL